MIEETTEEPTDWDTAPLKQEQFGFDAAAVEDFLATSSHCFWARLAKDGRPIGTYGGCAYHDGELYLVSNVFRKAYAAIKRDPRITVVLSKHDIGQVTIIGRAEPIDDYEMVRRFFLRYAPKNSIVKSGQWTVDEFMAIACTRNRRLIRVVRDRVLSLDMSKLSRSD